jgi:hypothetical protein
MPVILARIVPIMLKIAMAGNHEEMPKCIMAPLHESLMMMASFRRTLDVSDAGLSEKPYGSLVLEKGERIVFSQY